MLARPLVREDGTLDDCSVDKTSVYCNPSDELEEYHRSTCFGGRTNLNTLHRLLRKVTDEVRRSPARSVV